MTPTSSLQVELVGAPMSFPMAARRSFELELRVKNVGAAVVDCRLARSVLLIDGQAWPLWMENIGNGMRDRRWHGLPPGDTVTTRTTLGDEGFPQPGEHRLALQVLDATSPEIVVTVTP